VKIAKFDEILTLLSNQLKITPHAFPLYFSISRAYYKKGDFEQAAKICQFLVELNLEVFEYWELLIKTFIKMQNFACALICLNNLPLYSVNCRNFEVSAKNLQRPETLSCSADKNFWTTPKDPDFIAFEHVSSSKSVKERSLLKKLQGLPSAKYTGGYRRGYKLLVKIEKAVEWDNLLKIRSDNLRRSNLQIDDPESESISTDLNRSGFIRTVYESIEYSVNIDTRIDFSIQPAQCLTVRNYFLSENPVNKLAKLFDFSHRQQSEGTSDFFASLHMDLKSVYEWQKEVSNIQVLYDSSQSKSYSEIPYSGEVWLLRAMLSERLMRFKSALRAYEYVTQKGFSLFAWSRIIHLTARAGCPANTIKAVVEVMKFVEMQKVFFDKIPPWIECVLARLCKECGVRQVISLIKEHPAKFKVLEEAVGKLKYWEVEGSR
jgi:tetratricopeptide (TPR) repeat protein